MIRAVYDTNVLISAFISDGYPRDIFKAALQGKVILITSENLISEFKNVISREKFSFSPQQVEKMVAVLRKASLTIVPKQKLRVIVQDPEDNFILECAVEGDAEYIVSGDRHLLDLHEYMGVKTVTARQFAKFLEVRRFRAEG